jgi:hypothetical protein
MGFITRLKGGGGLTTSGGGGFDLLIINWKAMLVKDVELIKV